MGTRQRGSPVRRSSASSSPAENERATPAPAATIASSNGALDDRLQSVRPVCVSNASVIDVDGVAPGVSKTTSPAPTGPLKP